MILIRSKGQCYWCKKYVGIKKLTQDHVIPLSRGGSHDESNVVAACGPCNSRKGAEMWNLC